MNKAITICAIQVKNVILTLCLAYKIYFKLILSLVLSGLDTLKGVGDKVCFGSCVIVCAVGNYFSMVIIYSTLKTV